MGKIEELEQKVKELVEEIEQLKNQQKKVVCSRFMPKKDEIYWYVNSMGEIYNCNWTNTEFSQYRLANFPIFRTGAEAKRYLEFRKELAKRRWLVTEEELGNNNILKYYIAKVKGEIYADYCNLHNRAGTIYFKTREDAQYMIDNFEDILRMELI